MFGKLRDTLFQTIYGIEKQSRNMSFYSCVDKNMKGEPVKMSDFQGQVLLAINVASKCGATFVSYTELPKLYDEFGSRGFKVLAFPCNQFGAQEPGTHEEILDFVKKYDPDMEKKVVFFEKADVNGAKTREVYSFLKQSAKSNDGGVEIGWNFVKFLIDHEGNPYKRYEVKDTPLSMKDDIEALLKKKESS